MGTPITTREILVVLGDPPPPPSLEPTECDTEYQKFEYGTGIVYGGAGCPSAEELFVDIDTPARDLIQIVTSVEFTVNAAYLNVDNYTIIDLSNGKPINVREVLKPENSPTSDRILLVVDKHVSGLEYSISVKDLLIRTGATLSPPVVGSFFARDAKANSMLAALPEHFNMDPRASTMRLVLQALAESDDRIGSL